MLTSANAPRLALRLKLWTTCLPAVLTYGLHTLALTDKHIDQLQAACARQLRALARSPSHLSHETTAALLSRLKVKTVKQILSQAQDRLLVNLETLEAEGSIFPHTTQWLRDNISVFSQAAQPHALTSPPVSYTCDRCREVFTDFRLYCVHQSIAHSIKASTRRQQVALNRQLHSVAGLPLYAICATNASCAGQGYRHTLNRGGALALTQMPQVHRQLTPIVQLQPVPCLSWLPLCYPRRLVMPLPQLIPFHALHRPSVPSSMPVTEANAPLPSQGTTDDAPPASASTPSACHSLGLRLPGSGTAMDVQNFSWQKQAGPAATIPMLQRPSLLHLLRARGWQVLLQNPEVRDELRLHCPECMQWCSTPAGLTVHMTHSHPRWTQEQPSVLARAALLRRVVTKPCQYCLADKFRQAAALEALSYYYVSVLHGNQKS